MFVASFYIAAGRARLPFGDGGRVTPAGLRELIFTGEERLRVPLAEMADAIGGRLRQEVPRQELLNAKPCAGAPQEKPSGAPVYKELLDGLLPQGPGGGPDGTRGSEP